MANLGSEVARFYRALSTNASDRAIESRIRAFHIIDELLASSQMQGHTGEIEILRDVIEDASTVAPKYSVKAKDLELYFMPFAMRTLQSV